MYRTLLALPFLIAACQGDETASAYAGTDVSYVLQEIDGKPFTATATLRFPEAGKVAGDGPCNSYHADQPLPYPWFKVDRVASTRKACPDLTAEHRYFSSLQKMTLIEVSGPLLILGNEDGEQMLFKAAP